MNYVDLVYGAVTIDEPVVLDLLASPSMQRLKKVDQSGFPEPFHPNEDRISRFDHSVGVFLLLKRFGVPIEEQIAGLLHDVSHTVFSHCADYMGSQEYQKKQACQDDTFESYVRHSEIPSILERHNVDLSYILDDLHFPLKEKALPDLCADRIDYSLRTALATYTSSREEIQALLHSLTTNGTHWFFTSLDSCRRYASLFSYLNKHHYSGLTSAVMFYTVGAVLRHSIAKAYLTPDELYTTDEGVLKTISKYALKDPELQRLVDRMYNKVPYLNDPKNYHAHVFCKSRVVDPLCLHEGSLERLSRFHTDWENHLNDEMIPKSYYIRFEEH